MPVKMQEIGDAGTLELIAAVYALHLKEHGTSHTGVLWQDEASQRRRFIEFLPLLEGGNSGSGFSLNDLGCGYGAFYEFLTSEFPSAVIRYHGYDICRDMVQVAEQRITDPCARISLSDMASETCDYSFASGTFNMMANMDADDWTAYVKQSLLALWEKSNRGLAFNLLDASAVLKYEPWLYYTQRDEYFDFCRTAMSPDVEWTHTPGAPDYTLLVRR